MSILTVWPFTRSQLITLRDPFFGRLRFDPKRNQWQGYLDIPLLSRETSIGVHADIHGPTDNQREKVASFVVELPALLPVLQSAVCNHYKEIRKLWKDIQLPDYNDSQQLWNTLTFGGLKVMKERGHFWPELDLMLWFDKPWDEEHGLQLAIGANKLLEVRGE